MMKIIISNEDKLLSSIPNDNWWQLVELMLIQAGLEQVPPESVRFGISLVSSHRSPLIGYLATVDHFHVLWNHLFDNILKRIKIVFA